MLLDNGLADVQTQAQALSGCAWHGAAWRAVERLPHPLLLLGRQAWTLVSDFHARLALANYQRYLEWWIWRGIFERVGQIVGQHLTEPVAVRDDWHCSLGIQV